MKMQKATAKTDVKVALREAQRKWLDDVCAATGLTLTEIAKEAGVNPSTLTRFRNQPDHKGTLTPLTVNSISQTTGVPIAVPGGELPLKAIHRAREAEPVPLEAASPEWQTVLKPYQDEARFEIWALRGRALEFEGYRPGDVVIVDREARPDVGDVVCAHVSDWQRGGETVFRLYHPPFLLGAGSDDAARRPRFLDEQSTQIKGVVVMSLRGRSAVKVAA
ncbi:SOS-response transcriptional repressor LexA [Chelatococcus asaccharovorans]|uniref:SOS-response transcriptional repressor LexA n=2 Tax=Chelatococcus asaccharovorans TaxID=28210 RepID=A0A2V3UBF0_9HYPH|nr:SOS-response transcriptional repressor LexA [Chelatococcus asaccharovorans]